MSSNVIASQQDLAVMAQIGKRQQFNRIFGFLPTLGLSLTLLASWESVASGFAAGLTNGGPVSLIYGMILSVIGTMCLAMSLAEMASICPIAGAQYHWTYMFAPKRIAPFATWMQGWITVFAWQATATSVTYLAATQIQGLLILNYTDSGYVAQGWHGTLLMWAVVAVYFCVNVFGIKILPWVELMGGIFHVVFFIILLVTLVLLAPRADNDFVWASFTNAGGWPDGVSFSVGLLTSVYCFVGFDGAIHMSEEVKDAPKTIPKILVLTILINGALAFVFMIVLLYSLGNLDAITNFTPSTGYVVIAVFKVATQSNVGASLMYSAIIVIAFASGFALLASVSRLTFAFARDGGLPFSTFFSRVDATWKVPIRSLGLVSVVIMLLSLINTGSSAALNAILSLSTLGLYVSYLVPIGFFLTKRIRGDHIEFGPWRMGKFGLPVNAFALIFGTYVSVFLPFPGQTPSDAANMNWSGPVFGFLVVVAFVDWVLRGRKYYQGPTRDDGTELDRSSRSKSSTVITTKA